MPDRLQDVDLWLVDSLVVPASLHDTQGRFVHVNKAAERASGFSNAQWIGRHLTERLPPEARRRVKALFRLAVERGEPTELQAGQIVGFLALVLPATAGLGVAAGEAVGE